MKSTKFFATSVVTAGVLGLGISDAIAGGGPLPEPTETRGMNRVSACLIYASVPSGAKVSVYGGVNSRAQCKRKAEAFLKKECRKHRRDEGAMGYAFSNFHSYDGLSDRDTAYAVFSRSLPLQGEDYLTLDCTTGEFLPD